MNNTQLKQDLEMTMREYTNRTGIEVRYEHQPGNGNWLWFGSDDNNGEGLYVGVDGRMDALRTLEGMQLETEIKKNSKYAVDYEVDMNGNILDVACKKLEARSNCSHREVQEFTVTSSIYPILVPNKCEVCGNVEDRQFEIIIEHRPGIDNYYISDSEELDKRYCFGIPSGKTISFEKVVYQMVHDYIPMLLKEEAVMNAYYDSLDD